MPVKAANRSGNGPVTSPPAGITIPRLQTETIKVSIIGTTPLISECWSVKAKQMMLDAQMKRAKQPRSAKDPEADFKASLYVADEGWFGFPAGAFKAAIVGATRQTDGITMTLAKRLCFVLADGYSTLQNAELVRIHGEPTMRQDMMRNESGVADIRFHGEFLAWEATLTVEFNGGIVSAEQIVNLIDLAGYSEGIGGHRPSAPKNCTGNNGRWRVRRGE